MKYFLKGDWEEEYTEVTKEQYIAAERNAGFYSNESFANKVVTAAFSGHSISGKVEYENEDIISFDGEEECL
jgi:hypothetical protein